MRRKNSPPPPACRDRGKGNRQLSCWFYFLLWFWWLKKNSWKTNSNEKFTNSDWRKSVGQGWVLSVSLILGRPGNKLKVPRLDFRSNNLVCVPSVRVFCFFSFFLKPQTAYPEKIALFSRLREQGKPTEHKHLPQSASWLWIQCDQPNEAPAAGHAFPPLIVCAWSVSQNKPFHPYHVLFCLFITATGNNTPSKGQ